ncbi:MAG: 23S rRNA (pseudouridine(1915)-N(3))-methyltransferase RlmH [Puniceicoccales bacterium]
MFRFTLLVVGKLKNAHLRKLCEDYAGRLSRQGRLDVIELRDSDTETEGARLSEAIDGRANAVTWVLSEEGKAMRSADLATRIHDRQGGEMTFVIGGPYGLSNPVKQRADQLFSLSPMTFTHEMARFLLLEQLYRAVSINAGSKYHHE